MNRSTLINRHQLGEQFAYIPFFGGFMSQWYPSKLRIDGNEYLTAEQYMMAEKARCFDDYESLRKIRATKDPSKAKAFGRKVEGFNDLEWDVVKYGVVVKANMVKFGEDPELREFLLGTENHILVEASPTDVVWGIGMSEDNPDCYDPTLWRGQNLLGFAIMDVRDKLRE